MSKFGEIINSEIPVVISFYSPWSESYKTLDKMLHNVASLIGAKARVIKIDVGNNNQLIQALKVTNVPTIMIYKRGQMVWRRSGEIDGADIITAVQQFS
ncbi:MAG: thioredoxin family protein [Bacteroidota bacterium]|nr:thioredoxin family protein [Bacteroidota bacterium]